MYAQCKTMTLSRNHCNATMQSVCIVELHHCEQYSNNECHRNAFMANL